VRGWLVQVAIGIETVRVDGYAKTVTRDSIFVNVLHSSLTRESCFGINKNDDFGAVSVLYMGREEAILTQTPENRFKRIEHISSIMRMSR
jgi:hypothetical protein